MTDWEQLARVLHPDLPEEQARKIAPILAGLEASFRPLVGRLTFTSDSATPFIAVPEKSE